MTRKKKLIIFGLIVVLTAMWIISLWFQYFHLEWVAWVIGIGGIGMVVWIFSSPRFRVSPNTQQITDTPKGFMQSIWPGIIIMSPFVIFLSYNFWRINDCYTPASRILLTIVTTQYFALMFIGAAIVAWYLIRWIEKTDPAFFLESESPKPPLELKT